jgi:hypothetical protein
MKIISTDIKLPVAIPEMPVEAPLGQEIKAAVLDAIAPERGNMTLLDGYDETKSATQTVENIKETEELRVEYQRERAQQVAAAIARIRRGQGLIESGGRNALAAIKDAGIDPAKLTFAEMQHIVSELAGTPMPIADGELAEALAAHGLEPTGKYTKALENSWDKLPQQISDAAAKKLLESDQALTADNLYKAVHTGAKLENAPPAPENMIADYFARQGIEKTPENLNSAQFLLSEDVEISQENIDKLQFLKGFSPDKLSRWAFFYGAAEKLAAGEGAGSVDLTQATKEAEVALKMALEAARRLALDIDVQALQKHVKLLQATGMTEAQATEAAPLLEETLDAAELMKFPTANAAAAALRTEGAFTMGGTADAIAYAQANAGYEANATVPKAGYGDGLHKVSADFGPFLERLGVASTEANMRAAFILAKNSMEITPDSLLNVKTIDMKITTIAETLHPMAAAHMIKDGLNPLTMPADDVLSYIKSFELHHGISAQGKIAEHIAALDAENALEPATREAMVAVYRVLNAIRRDGASALGLAAQMEGVKAAPLTLGDMLNLAQKKQVDATPTGEMEAMTAMAAKPESLRNILSQAAAYPELLADKIIDATHPSELRKMLEAPATPLEDAVAAAQRNAVKPPPSAQSEIATFAAANPEIINAMRQQGVATTAGNIEAWENENPAETLAEIFDELPDTSLADLQNGEDPAEILARLFASAQSAPAKHQLAISHGKSGDYSRGFEVPIKIAGGIANLQVYVANEKAITDGDARILLAITLPALGAVAAYFTVEDDRANIEITALPHAVAALQGHTQALQAFLAEAGAQLGELTFKTTATPQAAVPQFMGHIPQTEYDFIA